MLMTALHLYSVSHGPFSPKNMVLVLDMHIPYPFELTIKYYNPSED